MLQPQNEWQYLDEELGLIYPWFPLPLINHVKTLPPLNILEIGGGWSTLWWNRKGHKVYTVDSNESYVMSIIEEAKSRAIPIGEIVIAETESVYREAILKGKEKYDAVIFDGAFREETIIDAWSKVRRKGFMIVDNWQQPEVSVYPDAIVKQLPEPVLFKQSNHPHWQAAIFNKK